MRLVVDGLPLYGTSVSITAGHLLTAWNSTFPHDELHVVTRDTYRLDVPAGVNQHPVRLGRSVTLGRLRAQNRDLPALCRRIRPDAVLTTIPSTSIVPLPCPTVVINHDLRHELRPEQFGRAERLVRRMSYSAAFRQAAGVVNISARTRDDLLRSRPWLARRVVRVAHHGADHVNAPDHRPNRGRYAITFGQYGNKRVDDVIRAWALLPQHHDAIGLKVVGLGGAAGVDTSGPAAASRQSIADLIDSLGLHDRVELLPWLGADQFSELFAGAELTVLASDFEGFGLPALEAMRFGIPVVFTPEPALLEVTGGHGFEAAGNSPVNIAKAADVALTCDVSTLEAARDHASTFTWARSAATVRQAVLDSIANQRTRHQ